MPVKSYLAIAKEGQKALLAEALNGLPECEITPSENKNVLVVITETIDEEGDKQLFQKLNSLENLQLLTLVAAFSNQSESTQIN